MVKEENPLDQLDYFKLLIIIITNFIKFHLDSIEIHFFLFQPI